MSFYYWFVIPRQMLDMESPFYCTTSSTVQQYLSFYQLLQLLDRLRGSPAWGTAFVQPFWWSSWILCISSKVMSERWLGIHWFFCWSIARLCMKSRKEKALALWIAIKESKTSLFSVGYSVLKQFLKWLLFFIVILFLVGWLVGSSYCCVCCATIDWGAGSTIW